VYRPAEAVVIGVRRFLPWPIGSSRTTRSGRLATMVPGKVAAFEVDDIDVVTRTGRSVLGVAEAYEVCDPERLAELTDKASSPGRPARSGGSSS
jgi:hypothetical protein